MSYASNVLSFEFHKEQANKDRFKLEISIDFKGLAAGLAHAIFVGPKLVRRDSPNSYSML